MDAITASSVKPLKDTFKAWINGMPGPGAEATLHVIGWAVSGSAGAKAELKAAVPPGLDPTTLILELVSSPPQDVGATVMTPLALHYQDAVREPVRQVQIRNGQDIFPIDVENPV